MNTKQKTITWVGIILIALLTMFPPWKFTCTVPKYHLVQLGGYACVFSPPEVPEAIYHRIGGSPIFWKTGIDTTRLIVPIAGIAIVCGALLLLFKDRKN